MKQSTLDLLKEIGEDKAVAILEKNIERTALKAEKKAAEAVLMEEFRAFKAAKAKKAAGK